MSRDRGTENHPVDQGYGLITDIAGNPLGDLIVSDANQEHGIVTARDTSEPINYEMFPMGSLLRVLPNHACATAAQYTNYLVVEGDEITDHWHSIAGW